MTTDTVRIYRVLVQYIILVCMYYYIINHAESESKYICRYTAAKMGNARCYYVPYVIRMMYTSYIYIYIWLCVVVPYLQQQFSARYMRAAVGALHVTPTAHSSSSSHVWCLFVSYHTTSMCRLIRCYCYHSTRCNIISIVCSSRPDCQRTQDTRTSSVNIRVCHCCCHIYTWYKARSSLPLTLLHFGDESTGVSPKHPEAGKGGWLLPCFNTYCCRLKLPRGV